MVTRQQPLKGFRILDLSRLLPGPFCTRVLADLGAEVIKIESPKHPDMIGQFPPFLDSGVGEWDVRLNKGKKRIFLDYFEKSGARILLQLIKSADVLIHSFRPGVMSSLGLSEKQLHRANPSLIFVSLVGFSKKSGLDRLAGHDLNFVATSGFLSLIETKASLPHFPFADVVSGGLMGAIQILAHLLLKKRRHVSLELSLTDQLVYLYQFFMNANHASSPRLLCGEFPYYAIYETSDRVPVVLGAIEQKFWTRFVVGLEDRQLQKMNRESNKTKVYLRQIFASHSAKWWRAFALKHDCCLSVLSDVTDLIEMGLLKKSKIKTGQREFEIIESSLLGGSNQNFEQGTKSTRAVLKSVGYTADDLRQFLQQGLIQ